MGLMARESLWSAIFVVLIILVLGFHAISLTQYPVVNGDEPWFADAVWNFANNGILFDTMHTGPLDQFGYEWVRRCFLGIVPWVVSFKLFGVGLLQTRATSLVCGFFLLLLTWFAGRKMYGNQTGLLAALLVAVSPQFLHSAHFGRQEILLAGVLMLAFISAWIALERERGWAHFVTGLILGFSVDVHQNGWLFIPAFAVMYLMHYRWRLLRSRGMWLALAGGLIGVLYYALVFVLPNPEVYFRLHSFSFTGNNGLSLLSDLPGLANALREEIGRYRFYDNNLIFAVIGAGAVYLLARARVADRRLVVFVGVTFLVFAFLRSSKTYFYAILLFPFMMLIAAETFSGLVRNSQSLPRAFALGLLGMFLLNSGLHLVRPVMEENRGYNYEALGQQIRAVIPAGAKVLGLPTWWFALPSADYTYHSSLTLNYYAFFNDYTLEEGLSAIRPDYIIIDDILRGVLLSFDQFTTSPFYGVPGDEFYAFLDEQGQLVLELENKWHGVIEVYAVTWDESD